jgi:asparagine synthase (glutamine-hydrolysing)
MAGIAALISKNGRNVSEPLTRMLRAMKHRGGDSYGIADKQSAVVSASLPGAEEAPSTALLGCCNRRLLPGDLEQPLHQYGYALAFDGRLYPSSGVPDAFAAAEHLGRDPEKGIARLLTEANGSYALAVLDGNCLFCARDPLGATPLYVGENPVHFAVASEKKALWSIDIENPAPLPPGHLAKVTGQGITLKPVKVLKPPELRRLGEEEAVQLLREILLQAVDTKTRDVERVAIGFSGGLDSGLLAYFADACEIEVDLISVGVEGSGLGEAVEAAESLGLPYYAELHGMDEVEEDLDKALLCVEEPDPLKAAIAVPLLWVAEKAAELGDRVLLLGQGCDELFGGYRKHLDAYLRGGAEAASNLMFRDVVEAYERNYEPNNKVAAYHGVELRLPFVDWELTQFALSLHVELKLSPENHLGKQILRMVGEGLGVPSAITARKKRAIQYSTGVDKALRKIAKRQGLTLTGFLQRRFAEALSSCESLKGLGSKREPSTA